MKEDKDGQVSFGEEIDRKMLEEAEKAGKTLYICDPTKAVTCAKNACFTTTGTTDRYGTCYLTTNEKFAAINRQGEAIRWGEPTRLGRDNTPGQQKEIKWRDSSEFDNVKPISKKGCLIALAFCGVFWAGVVYIAHMLIELIL